VDTFGKQAHTFLNECTKLTEHVASEARKALQAEGKDLPKTSVDEVVHTMIHEPLRFNS
jgi:hypothetical protein